MKMKSIVILFLLNAIMDSLNLFNDTMKLRGNKGIRLFLTLQDIFLVHFCHFSVIFPLLYNAQTRKVKNKIKNEILSFKVWMKADGCRKEEITNFIFVTKLLWIVCWKYVLSI